MIPWMSSTAIGSMPEKGSSSNIKDGDITSERAISTLRLSPPDKCFAVLFLICLIEKSFSRVFSFSSCSALFKSENSKTNFKS